jgi:hypothetical protein
MHPETQRNKAMNARKKIENIPETDDQKLAEFWEKNEPEDFDGWKEGELDFRRPPKKLIRLRLDPSDVRMIVLTIKFTCRYGAQPNSGQVQRTAIKNSRFEYTPRQPRLADNRLERSDSDFVVIRDRDSYRAFG